MKSLPLPERKTTSHFGGSLQNRVDACLSSSFGPGMESDKVITVCWSTGAVWFPFNTTKKERKKEENRKVPTPKRDVQLRKNDTHTHTHTSTPAESEPPLGVSSERVWVPDTSKSACVSSLGAEAQTPSFPQARPRLSHEGKSPLLSPIT